MITEDGNVRCYFDLQGDFTQFSLGNVSTYNPSAAKLDILTDYRARKKPE